MHPSVFKQPQTQEIIKFVREEYGDELEFLWPKFDNNAIWRNPRNKKWYAALLTVQESKLEKSKATYCGGPLRIGNDEIVEIIDLRFEKNQALDFAAGTEHIYPGWHMNKQNWITIILDGSIKTEQIKSLIDQSYKITLES